MSLQVEKMEKNMAKLTIEVSAEELEKAIQGAYLKQRKHISVPGFRKGKVPRQMIEKMYGVEIMIYSIICSVVATLMIDNTHEQNICSTAIIFTKKKGGEIKWQELKEP